MSRFLHLLGNQFSLLIHSIRFRLALWFVVILAVVIVFFSTFVYTRQVWDLRSAAVSRLEKKVQRFGVFLRYSGRDYFEGRVQGVPTDPASEEPLLQEGDVLAFVDPGGRILQNWGPIDAEGISRWVEEGLAEDHLEAPFTADLHPTNIEVEDSQVEYMMVVVPVVNDRRTLGYFFLGSPVDPDGQLPRLFLSLSLGVLTTLAVAFLGGFWLADRAIHPVKRITEAARTISETDLSLRLQLNRRDELGELADTFDRMLARLQAAFERQRQFTADASHELRTPLTIVDLETSRALAAQRPAKEYERALGVIRSENQYMIRLVTNLLTLARMDAGQVVLQQEVLDLSDIALEVVERLAPLAVKEQVRLIAGDLPELPIVGDRQHLSQMITNLVENGIKYSAGEDRRVIVETGSRTGQEGDQAWLRVSDNGPGIPPEHLPLLFERFYQVDSARTRQDSDLEMDDGQEESGAGLGLSIAKWIASAHRGNITVQSEVSAGSIFEVSLPLVAERSPSTISQKTSPSSAA